MTTPLVPDQVRAHINKMRELVDTIEKAPVQEIGAAIKNLRTELDTLMSLVNKASSVRRL